MKRSDLLKLNLKNKKQIFIGISLIFISFITKFTLPYFLDLLIKSQLVFVKDSYHFNHWRTNQYPYDVEFYFFNWTNSEQIKNSSVKPHFQEVGPYGFDLFINRTHIQINTNDTVTYSFTKRFIHKESQGGNLEDKIIIFNPVANSLAYQVRHSSTFLKFGAGLALRATKANLSIIRTIRELLFEGYSDPLLDLGRKLPKFGFQADLKDKFGFFYKRNYTDLYFGPYNVYTNPKKSTYGDLHTINYLKRTPYFPGQCGKVYGKLGEYADPGHDQKKPVVVYIHDLNVYTENFYLEERIFDGLVGSVYSPRKGVFDNGTFDKTNECFCLGECVPVGLLNTSSTFSNAPIFMSMPHFFLADDLVKQGVDIDYKDEGNLMPFIAIDQMTGSLLDGSLNIQLNMLLQPIKGLGMFSSLPKLFFPIMTIKQHVVPRGSYMILFYYLQRSSIVINCISVILLITGVALLLFGRIVEADVSNDYRQIQLQVVEAK